jgi:succinate dehydrogenase/fumarate reductase flavoprotein subunit
VVTDNINGGTSRNAGSDKQTYYKISDSSPVPDSPYDMAASYIRGGAMHGDLALVEAQGSSRAFYNLVALGVEFPFNRYGGYIGYQTDHDSRNRGISLGPYTSRVMVEALKREASRLGLPIGDHQDVVKLLVYEGRAAGALILNKRELDSPTNGLNIILADHVVFGTGGPAGYYEASVYPRVHTGGIGLALEIGAQAVNLTESQFGIASTKFRWNLSGSFQQVIPCYYSTDSQGNGREDFLLDYFDTWKEFTQAIFLKGYQWPFDVAKLEHKGSSLIDLLVYHETKIRGRRVFVDYRMNPSGRTDWKAWSKDVVSAIAIGYLDNSQAWDDTPIARLAKLNPEAIELYRKHGIDLHYEPLEIDLCAQHNNGGLAGDIWWESTNIKRLYPVGEVNGSHGVSRPGGSALNAGQVGALRAAQRIIGYGPHDTLDIVGCRASIRAQVEPLLHNIWKWLGRGMTLMDPMEEARRQAVGLRRNLQMRMTRFAGPVRDAHQVGLAVADAKELLEHGLEKMICTREILPHVLRTRHMLIGQYCYLRAIEGYLAAHGGSRGSFVVVDALGTMVHPLLSQYRIIVENPMLREVIQTISYKQEGRVDEVFTPCRPIPTEEFWFERVWAEFRDTTYLL